MKIAVAIDDDKMSLDIMEELLAESGYQVVTFSESSKAMEFVQAAESPIDLFLIDVRVKDQAGLEILKYLRYSDKKHQQAPVIMMSAASNKEYVEKAFNLGASGYVSKPFDEWGLMQKIREALK